MFYLSFSAKHFLPSRGCRCDHFPSQVFVVSSSDPPPCRWPAGDFSHDSFLGSAPVFPSISTRTRLAIVLYLWLVCRRAFPAPSCRTGGMRQVLEPFLAPPRHTGGTRQVFDGWLLPCCRVCVSSNCFSSRVTGSVARPLEVWEWVLRSRIFDSWSSSWNRSFPESHILCGSSGWASVKIRPRMA